MSFCILQCSVVQWSPGAGRFNLPNTPEVQPQAPAILPPPLPGPPHTCHFFRTHFQVPNEFLKLHGFFFLHTLHGPLTSFFSRLLASVGSWCLVAAMNMVVIYHMTLLLQTQQGLSRVHCDPLVPAGHSHSLQSGIQGPVIWARLSFPVLLHRHQSSNHNSVGSTLRYFLILFPYPHGVRWKSHPRRNGATESSSNWLGKKNLLLDLDSEAL